MKTVTRVPLLYLACLLLSPCAAASEKNQVVVDSASGLMWMKEDFSRIEGRFANSWDDAQAWAKKINQRHYGGFSDWYVPSIQEYRSINKNAEDRKKYRQQFLEITTKHSWGTGPDGFWSRNSPSKHVGSYISFKDGFATSGDKSGIKNAQTGEIFGMSVRLVRKISK